MSATAPAPEKLPFPANSVIIVRETFRAHSSGSENHSTIVFGSYESASKYIINQFREGGDAEMYWDEDDCFEEEGDEEPLPRPTIEWARGRFNPTALKELIGTAYEGKIYGPYSEFCAHHPYEIFIELSEIH
jgi:hypothetical protein